MRLFHGGLLGLACSVALFAAPAWPQEPPLPETISFNRDVRPILSNSCFACHGPDEAARQAGLRLDVRAEAVDYAFLPGDADNSELIARVTSDDPGLRMPPVDSNRPELTPRQVEILRRWIDQGAEYEGHWAYIAPQRPSLPKLENNTWSQHPVDLFILRMLRVQGLEPSPEADRRTLIRRLSFDLTGLPPTPEEVEAFVNDPSPEAYEKVVDRLLASQHYGERMAVFWLDLVRYADSIGYHSDNPREVSMYRDYVIRAFNQNMPFDRFTIEQLAGDLLPNPTWEQKVASGYNLLLQTTEEGGAQPKEYMAKYSADRVRNVSSVWLSTTLACAECHDHKFDPFTMKDFYSLAAFFADIQEPAVGRRPQIPVLTPELEEQQRAIEAKIAQTQRALEADSPELAAAQAAWEAAMREHPPAAPELGPWRSLGPFQAANFNQAHDRAFPPERESAIDLNKTYAGKLKWVERPEWSDGQPHELKGDNSATYLYRTLTVAQPTTVTLSLGSDDGIKVWLNGELIHNNKVGRGVAPDQDRVTANLQAGENRLLMKISNAAGGYAFYFRIAESGLPEKIAQIIRTPIEDRTDAQEAELATFYRGMAPLLEPQRKQLAALQQELEDFKNALPTSLIVQTGTPREIRILPRGNWLDDSGPVVEPAVPAHLGGLDVEGRRANRLDLARWLVRPENPLTARTMANRLWRLFFGEGIARTMEDFGAQGQWPTHPELLDWLAVEYVESGWDTKHLVKLIVTSAAYQQSSFASEEHRRRDPTNLWLARQNRFRLDAEMVRDTALAVSGLLARQVGGPSVKPYQPAGYWAHLNFPVREWDQDEGPSLYRRGLYTHWQRTFLHPSLLAFDAPSREECTAERPRSNTPQQALVLLNDPTYVEAARVFAERIVREGGETPSERLAFAFREALSRTPSEQEVNVLSDLVARHREQYQSDPQAAAQLLDVGEWPTPTDLDSAALAAWTSAARVILNLPECIMRN